MSVKVNLNIPGENAMDYRPPAPRAARQAHGVGRGVSVVREGRSTNDNTVRIPLLRRSSHGGDVTESRLQQFVLEPCHVHVGIKANFFLWEFASTDVGVRVGAMRVDIDDGFVWRSFVLKNMLAAEREEARLFGEERTQSSMRRETMATAPQIRRRDNGQDRMRSGKSSNDMLSLSVGPSRLSKFRRHAEALLVGSGMHREMHTHTHTCAHVLTITPTRA